MKHMQHGKSGLRLLQITKIRQKDGAMCETVEDRLVRWTEHITGVLNIETTFDLPHIENLKQQEEVIDLTRLPDLEELTSAIEMLKPNKAAGTNGILPEMVNCVVLISSKLFLTWCMMCGKKNVL